MSYLRDARNRLGAIKKLAEGKPDTHVYKIGKFGKVCVGCGRPKFDAQKTCPGNFYDEDPTRLLQFKLAGVAILALEVEELIKRLEVADEALAALAKPQPMNSGIYNRSLDDIHFAGAALAKIRAEPTE